MIFDTEKDVPNTTEKSVSVKYSSALYHWLKSLSGGDFSLLMTEVSTVCIQRGVSMHPQTIKCTHGNSRDCKECMLVIISAVNKQRIKDYLHAIATRKPEDPVPSLDLLEK